MIPEGLLPTLPAPSPAVVADNPKVGVAVTSNCAATLCAALIVTTHSSVPLHPPPLQPENTDPRLSVAVRVTRVFCGKLAGQVAPPSMPEGLLLPLPEPVPGFDTVSAKLG